MNTLLWLLNLSLCVRAYEKDPGDTQFVVPLKVGDNVEFYQTPTMKVGIHLDKVSFQEAKEICTGRNGTLLVLSDEELADFVAEALGESAAGMSLWIGGEFIPATKKEQGEWRWVSGENIIKEPLPTDMKFPMTTLPYWADRPDLNSTEAACLVTDRCEHRRPLITGLPCWVKRPFICTVLAPEVQSFLHTELHPPVSTKEGKTFHLFHAESTWMEALKLCRDMGYTLAVVDKQDEFIKLQHRMRRVRPIMESAWTSGTFLDGKWVWASSNKAIATKVDKDTPELPPWYRPDNITMEGCLLADRHVCDYFVYVEARCDRRRNFICHEEPTKKQSPIIQVPGSKNLYMSTIKLTWSEAEERCRNCLETGTLLQLAFHNTDLLAMQVDWLVRAMTVLTGQEIRHIWLNARLHNDTFMWGNKENDAIKDPHFNYVIDPLKFSNSSQALLKSNGEEGFIIFCPGDFKTDPYLRNYKCLNMDRENVRNFYMYGLSCDFRQHFFCMVKDGNGATFVLDDTCKNAKHGVSANNVGRGKS